MMKTKKKIIARKESMKDRLADRFIETVQDVNAIKCARIN